MASLNAANRLEKPFVKNSKIIFTLNLGGKIRRGNVILAGQIVVTGGTTSGVVAGDGGPLNLIEHIFVRAIPSAGSRYPGGELVDADARSLARNSITQRSGKFFLDQGGSTLGGGAAATYPIYLSLPLYFADATQRNSLATSINTDVDSNGVPVYQSVQVEVDTADLSACFTGNDRAVDYSGLTVQWEDERVAIPGDTLVLYQESHVLQIAASAKRLLDEAMPRDGNFLSWQILAESAGTPATLSDALLNRLVVKGPTLEFDKYAQGIRQAMLDDEWADPSLTATGYYNIDFTDGAIQANTVPAGGLQTYLDVNNISGANLDVLRFFTRRVFSPMPASKN